MVFAGVRSLAADALGAERGEPDGERDVGRIRRGERVEIQPDGEGRGLLAEFLSAAGKGEGEQREEAENQREGCRGSRQLPYGSQTGSHT